MIVYVIRIFDIYVSDPSVGNIVYIHVVSQLYRLACCFNMPVSVFSLDFQNNSKFLVKSMCFIRRKYMNVKFVQKNFHKKQICIGTIEANTKNSSGNSSVMNVAGFV